MKHASTNTQNNIQDEVKAVCISTKSLVLLNFIDETVAELSRLQTNAKASCYHLTRVAEQLKTNSFGKEIDPDDVLTDLIERTEERLLELKATLETGRRDAESLSAEDRDSVVFEYSAAIRSLSRLYEAFEDARWAILNHDGLLSSTLGGKSYANS